MQRPRSITGEVQIIIAAGRPDQHRRDADNLPKAVLDLLVARSVIEEDAKVVCIISGWDVSCFFVRAKTARGQC